jgi:molybdopterin converting factor small subunit
MKVFIPTQLRSYTQSSEVQAVGETLSELIHDLNRQFPGIRFRMIDEQDQLREHIHIFINNQTITGLDQKLQAQDVVRIIGQISGGSHPLPT